MHLESTTITQPPTAENRVHPVLERHALPLARAAIVDHHQRDGSTGESECIRSAVSAYLREISEWNEVDHQLSDLNPEPEPEGSVCGYPEAHREGYQVAVKAFDAAVAGYLEANGSTPGVEDLFADLRQQAFDG